MGILGIVKKLLHPAKGEVWCLHRVVENRSIFPSNRELEITPDYLEQLIKSYRTKGYQFVKIDDICHSTPLFKKKKINISFDDGFVDIYSIAFPIFKKYDIPFTIFLSTDFPEKKADLWWIQLEKLAGNDIKYFESTIKRIYSGVSSPAEEMHKLTNTTIAYSLSEKYALNWAQITEMVESGLCTIGSHTCNHCGLTKVDNYMAKTELVESKEAIEKNIPNYKVNLFSYPHSMAGKSVEELVKSVGYQYAFLGYGGKIRSGDNPYLLNRRHILQQ